LQLFDSFFNILQQHNTDVHLLYESLQSKLEALQNDSAVETYAQPEDFESPLMSVPTPAPLA